MTVVGAEKSVSPPTAQAVEPSPAPLRCGADDDLNIHADEIGRGIGKTVDDGQNRLASRADGDRDEDGRSAARRLRPKAIQPAAGRNNAPRRGDSVGRGDLEHDVQSTPPALRNLPYIHVSTGRFDDPSQPLEELGWRLRFLMALGMGQPTSEVSPVSKPFRGETVRLRRPYSSVRRPMRSVSEKRSVQRRPSAS